MGKKSGPPPPDYTGLAEKTQASNQQATTAQTWANRADQVNPWGAQTWGSEQVVDPATGQKVTKWTQNTTLDPKLQAALDSQIAVQGAQSEMAEGLIGRMQSEYGTPMDWGNSQDWGNVAQAGQLTPGQLQAGLNFGGVQNVAGSDQSRQRAEDAIYKSASSRLDPQFAQRQTDLETQLANSGITKNSEAYSRAMDDFNRQKTDAYQQAQTAAITGGGAEAQRNSAMDLALRQQQVGEIGTQGEFANAAANLGFGQSQQAGAQNFNQQMAQANYQNQLRQQQLAEQMQQRGFSLNEMQALLQGQQVNMPSFGGYNTAGNAGGVDYSGAGAQQYQTGLQQQQMKNAATGQLLQGAGSIAGLMFSDKATKVLLRRLATHPRGFGIWLFRYIGETLPRVGVVAQEVRRYMPEAVTSLRGVLMVDYALIQGVNHG